MRALSCAALLAACGGRAPTTAPPARVDLVIHDVRLFDGVHASEHRTVSVRGGKIVAIEAATARAPAATVIVEGNGGTLLPGLIDAHAHVHGIDDLRAALDFGVTTEIDMYSLPDTTVALARDAAPGHARVVPAGFGATAPGGHGTEYGAPVPTLSSAAQADAFVAARVAEGSHHIKLILDDGSEYGIPFQSLDEATAAAIVTAAHARKLLVVAHVGSAPDVAEALAAGVDGLAHLVPQILAPDVLARIATQHVFVIPTLGVLSAICGGKPGLALAQDPHIAAALFPAASLDLARAFPPPPDAHLACEAPVAQVRALHAAGVPLLVGTDAPNPGTTHGASVHDELARLVAAGLAPTEALAAATSAPAAAFGLADLGVIRPGAIADLVLVEGDPTHDITATRAVRAVWQGGVAYPLAARRAEAAAARETARAKSAAWLGTLADFDRDDPATARFAANSDRIQGGTSSSKIALVPGGPPGSDGTGHGRALAVTGTVVAPPGQRGWAGASATLADADGAVDLSGAKRLRFWVRGQQSTGTLYVVRGPRAPSAAVYHVTPVWTEVAIDLPSLGPMDSVLSLTWAATSPGAFAFELDRVSLE